MTAAPSLAVPAQFVALVESLLTRSPELPLTKLAVLAAMHLPFAAGEFTACIKGTAKPFAWGLSAECAATLGHWLSHNAARIQKMETSVAGSPEFDVLHVYVSARR